MNSFHLVRPSPHRDSQNEKHRNVDACRLSVGLSIGLVPGHNKPEDHEDHTNDRRQTSGSEGIGASDFR